MLRVDRKVKYGNSGLMPSSGHQMEMRWLRFWASRKEAGGYVGETILGIGVILFLSFFFAALFERSRIPDVLLLTLVGIVLGPLTIGYSLRTGARSVGCSVLLLWS